MPHPLTTHLLTLESSLLTSATTHPFLKQAATSTLPLAQLKSWLAQDRLYALSYLNFIGSLLSHLSIPSTSNRGSTLDWRIADTLIDSLINIRREIDLFEQVARDGGWLREIAPEGEVGLLPGIETRAYQDLFAGATAQGRPVVVGLVVLWATEECYLRAWRYAAEQIGEGQEDGKQDEDVMRRVFIPNWTSDDFAAFVKKLAVLVDDAAAGIDEGGALWRECEVAFRQTLWCEREFFRAGEGQAAT